MLKDVKYFIQEFESMSEKFNLSLFEDFFESSSPTDYSKKLINTSPDENKKFIEEINNRIKEMSEKEKKDKNADETLEIIGKILDYNKKFFSLHQKLIKKPEPKKKI